MKILILTSLALILAFPAYGATNYKDVQTFSTDKATKPYIVIGETAEKAKKDETCIKKLQKKAVKNGGDALVNIEVKATGSRGVWGGGSVLHCEAIVVRWAKPGENGQTSINPDAPMPFLMK